MDESGVDTDAMFDRAAMWAQEQRDAFVADRITVSECLVRIYSLLDLVVGFAIEQLGEDAAEIQTGIKSDLNSVVDGAILIRDRGDSEPELI